MRFEDDRDAAADRWEEITESHEDFACTFSFKCGADWGAFESEAVMNLVKAVEFALCTTLDGRMENLEQYLGAWNVAKKECAK